MVLIGFPRSVWGAMNARNESRVPRSLFVFAELYLQYCGQAAGRAGKRTGIWTAHCAAANMPEGCEQASAARTSGAMLQTQTAEKGVHQRTLQMPDAVHRNPHLAQVAYDAMHATVAAATSAAASGGSAVVKGVAAKDHDVQDDAARPQICMTQGPNSEPGGAAER